MTKSLILDSYALLAFFQNEPGADSVREMILSAVEDKLSLAMCVINLGEVWYSIARKNSVEIADVCLLNIQGMPIEIVDADWSLAYQAAIYKVRGNISYADCYAAALAKLRKGEVVTGDREFIVLEDEVKITWLG
jgi:PIN domain nuclease of toxin-antitoxin system